ncbi:hypothetical protein OAI78_04575 [Rhodobiaceae bacterium]|nr:hypothetical protein [Rhodobiaceae bacterium]
MSNIKKINIPLSSRAPNVEIVESRLRIVKDGDELLFSEEETEFLLFKFEELKNSGESKKVISDYFANFLNVHTYLRSLTEEDRNLILDCDIDDEIN